MRWWPVGIGFLGAALTLALWFPSACGSTDLGFGQDGLDPNLYSCDSLLRENVDSLDGPTPGTSERKTGGDVLATRMMIGSGLPALAVMALGLGLGRWVGHADADPSTPPQAGPALVSYGIAVGLAVSASGVAAFALLNHPSALVPLMIPVIGPLLASWAPSRRALVVGGAIVFQLGFALAAALPIGFLYLPSAAALLLGGLLELFYRD
ncbi:MAG: hypothetical protein KJN63_01510 [Acidimicrobiia bacterium]|nr:hypothetical protein [Acidimicrobiia bacterium]